MNLSRRKFLRNAAGLLIPAAGFILPNPVRGQILPGILAARAAASSLSVEAQSNSGLLAASSTATFNGPAVTNANLLVIRASLLTVGGGLTWTCTYDGSASGIFEKFKHENYGDYDTWNICWYLLNPASAKQIVITPSGGTINGIVGATTFIGAHGTTPLSADTTKTGSSTGDTLTYVGTTVGRILLDIFMQDKANQTLTGNQSPDYTSRPSAGFNGMGQEAAGTGGNVDMINTNGATCTWTHSAFEVIPA